MSRILLGAAMMAAWNAMVQDLMGKEKYLRALDVLWINTHWTLWAATLLILPSLHFAVERIARRNPYDEALKRARADLAEWRRSNGQR